MGEQQAADMDPEAFAELGALAPTSTGRGPGETAGSNAAFKYRGFVSYSHGDRTWATWLHSRLESFQLPKELRGRSTSQGPVPPRMGRFYRDEAEEGAANELGGRIDRALASSDAMVVICSPASCQSKWVNKEITRFKELGRGHRIFLVVVAGELHSADPQTACFPSALKSRPADDDENLPEGWVEPIAVDARRFGRDDTLLRLVSGILDLEYDDLKRRELVRQRQNARRYALLASIGLVLAVGAIVAALIAVNQRGRALQALAESRATELAARARSTESERPELAIGLAMKSLGALQGYGERSKEGEAALRSAMALTRGRVTYCMPSLRDGQYDDTSSFDISPDGALLAVGTRSNVLCVFKNMPDGKFELAEALQSYGDSVTEARFSSDGKWLISVAGDHYPRALNISATVLNPTVKKFTTNNYKFYTFGGHDSADAISIDAKATRIAFVPSGTSVIEVWNLLKLDPDGKAEKTFDVKAKVLATGLAPDGRYLAALIQEGPVTSNEQLLMGNQSLRLSVRVWDLDSTETWSIASVLAKVEGALGDGIILGRLRGIIEIGPGGRWLAPALFLADQHSVARQMAAEVWFVPRASPPQQLRLFNGAYKDGEQGWSRVTRLGFTSDGRWLYASHEREVQIWALDVASLRKPGAWVLSAPYARTGARNAVGVIYDVASSSDGQRLAAVDSNGVLTVWDMSMPAGAGAPQAFFVEAPNKMFGSSERIRFSLDSKVIVAAGSHGAARVCSVEDACGPIEPRVVRTPPSEVQFKSWVADPKNSWLAGISEVNRVHFWHLSDLKRAFFVADLSDGGSEPVTTREYAVVSGSPGSPVRVVPSEDGEWAVAYKQDQYGFNHSLVLIRLGLAPAQFKISLDGLGCEKEGRAESFYSTNFDALGKRLFFANKWGCVASVPLPSPRAVPTAPLVPVRESSFTSGNVAFSRRYIAGSAPWLKEASTLWTRDLQTGRPVENIYTVQEGKILLTPDDSWIISTSRTGARDGNAPFELRAARIGNLAKPDRWESLESFNSKVTVALSPDWKWLVAAGKISGDAGIVVVLWRVGQFDKPAARWNIEFAAPPVITFSAAGSKLIVGPEGYPKSYKELSPSSVPALLIDLAQDKPMSQPIDVIIGKFDTGCSSSSGFSCRQIEYTFSADERFLATSDPGNVWDLSKVPARHLMFLDADDPVFSALGPWMATVGSRGIEIFKLETGALESSAIWSARGAVYFPTADRLLVLSSGTLFEHTLASDRLIKRAAAEMGRNMTFEEWTAEFPGEPYTAIFEDVPIQPSFIDDLILRAQTSARDGQRKAAGELFSLAADAVVKTRSVDACEVIVKKAARAGYPASVLAAADLEVATLPRSSRALETRAKVRAAAGLLDGAIADLEAANVLPSRAVDVSRRQAWIDRLRRGAAIPVAELYD